VKPAQVRFYVDADILGLGKVLAGLRTDVTHPGDPGLVLHRRHRAACPVTSPRAEDPEWIPVVAAAGWLVITRDRHILEHRREIEAVVEHRACLVALSAPDATTTWTQLETVMCQWRGIDELAALPGPFIYRATRTSLQKLDLE